MVDIAFITSALSGINSAIDIAKAIKNASSSIQEATLKLQLAGLMNALADSKTQIAELKNFFVEKETEIQELKKEIELIHSNEKPIIEKGCYRFKDDSNLYCVTCWEKDMKKISLTRAHPMLHKLLECTKCKAKYNT